MRMVTRFVFLMIVAAAWGMMPRMAISQTAMTVTSPAIKDGVFGLKYGKLGTQNLKGMPTCSFPFEIHNAPQGARSFAIFLEDQDAIPVSRFSWIHWVVANLAEPKLEEDASANPGGRFVQGVNSWASRLLGSGALTDVEAARYGGMAPPDKAHVYEMHVYALDTKLDLKDGFFANEMFKAMKGHVLAEAVLEGGYPAKP